MKKLYQMGWILGLCLGFWSTQASAQISILIVDDSDDSFGHISLFESVVIDLGYGFTSFDAQGTGTVPTATVLQAYDLVIWHTGADLDSLAFWNFADTSNLELESYLSSGGRLWLIGTDVLFDRYGAAPRSFASGTFPFDYLGVTSYDVQSYVDDSSMGMPQAEPDPNSPIMNLPTLSWIFPTLWYVDAVTPIPGGAQPVYMMGDTSYMFSGRTCGLWYDNGTSQALSFFFNVSQISDSATMSGMTAQVLDFFVGQLVGVDEAVSSPIELYPNPNTGSFTIRLGENQGEKEEIQLYDLDGRLQWQMSRLPGASREIQVRDLDLATGLYLLKVTSGNKEYCQKVQITR